MRDSGLELCFRVFWLYVVAFLCIRTLQSVATRDAAYFAQAMAIYLGLTIQGCIFQLGRRNDRLKLEAQIAQLESLIAIRDLPEQVQ